MSDEKLEENQYIIDMIYLSLFSLPFFQRTNKRIVAFLISVFSTANTNQEELFLLFKKQQLSHLCVGGGYFNNIMKTF